MDDVTETEVEKNQDNLKSIHSPFPIHMHSIQPYDSSSNDETLTIDSVRISAAVHMLHMLKRHMVLAALFLFMSSLPPVTRHGFMRKDGHDERRAVESTFQRYSDLKIPVIRCIITN